MSARSSARPGIANFGAASQRDSNHAESPRLDKAIVDAFAGVATAMVADVSRILRLALLPFDIVEAIVEGRTEHTLVPEQVERRLPACWGEQAAVLALGTTL